MLFPIAALENKFENILGHGENMKILKIQNRLEINFQTIPPPPPQSGSSIFKKNSKPRPNAILVKKTKAQRFL